MQFVFSTVLGAKLRNLFQIKKHFFTFFLRIIKYFFSKSLISRCIIFLLIFSFFQHLVDFIDLQSIPSNSLFYSKFYSEFFQNYMSRHKKNQKKFQKIPKMLPPSIFAFFSKNSKKNSKKNGSHTSTNRF
ncbi:MAG: hypothetical protein RL757_2099 [Bacteroidota bacterium]|jgi:hypothetical protein